MNPLMNQLMDAWYHVRQQAVTCCPQLFNGEEKSGQFDERSQVRGDHEMSSFKSFGDANSRPPAMSEYDELGKYGHSKTNGSLDYADAGFNEYAGDPRDKISAWQAGWNVTNAIQVIHSIYSYRIDCNQNQDFFCSRFTAKVYNQNLLYFLC